MQQTIKAWGLKPNEEGWDISPAGSTDGEKPSGIVDSYQRVMNIFKRASPMSNWNELTMALHELGHSIYGDK